MRSHLLVAGALVGACLLSGPTATTAAPLAGAMSKHVAAQAGDTSLVIQVQRRGRFRGGRGGGGGGGGNAAGAAAAGAAAGLLLGVIIASEAQRQQAANYCAQRYRSYDRASGTFMGRDGVRHPCP